jgi:hypothetical protein
VGGDEVDGDEVGVPRGWVLPILFIVHICVFLKSKKK